MSRQRLERLLTDVRKAFDLAPVFMVHTLHRGRVLAHERLEAWAESMLWPAQHGTPGARDATDPLRKCMLDLSRAFSARIPVRPPRRETVRTFVNGRGQLLQSSEREAPDFSEAIFSFLHSYPPHRAVDAAIQRLKEEPHMGARVHQCVNDGGAAYIQAFDADRAGIIAYVLDPFLNEYALMTPRGSFSESAFSRLYDRVFGALRGGSIETRIVTPVLGVMSDGELSLDSGTILRPPSEGEQERWRSDNLMDRSIARDLGTVECVLEISYTTSWGPDRRDEIVVHPSFDWVGFDGAISMLFGAIAAVRIVTGRALPLVLSEHELMPLPWVRNRFYHRPTRADVERRWENSPLFNRLVAAEPLDPSEMMKISALWACLRGLMDDIRVNTALRLFNDERDFINLYRIFELIQSDVGGNVKKWANKRETELFCHTANSPEAIGYARARHGWQRNSPPKEPMGLKDADVLIRRLLSGWIKMKGSAPGSI